MFLPKALDNNHLKVLMSLALLSKINPKPQAQEVSANNSLHSQCKTLAALDSYLKL